MISHNLNKTKTHERRPRLCVSVRLNILPPVKDFKIFVVAAPTLAFLLYAPTAFPTTGASVFIVGFRNLFHAVCDPSNIFFFVFLKPALSS